MDWFCCVVWGYRMYACLFCDNKLQFQYFVATNDIFFQYFVAKEWWLWTVSFVVVFKVVVGGCSQWRCRRAKAREKNTNDKLSKVAYLLKSRMHKNILNKSSGLFCLFVFYFILFARYSVGLIYLFGTHIHWHVRYEIHRKQKRKLETSIIFRIRARRAFKFCLPHSKGRLAFAFTQDQRKMRKKSSAKNKFVSSTK